MSRLAPTRMWLSLVAAAFTTAIFALAAPAAHATDIQRIVSPGGIKAWLVQESSVPVISVEFAMDGGSQQDPAGKPGVANMAASLLDEGAGDLDSEAFRDALERKAIEMRFDVGRDHLRGTLRTLSENKDAAFDYFRLALTAPRFDVPAVERIRAQIMSALHRDSTDPRDISSVRWWKAAFPNHPYGQPVEGTLKSVPTITVADLKDYADRVLAREHLYIAVVGDIDAETAARMLDHVFGDLPVKAKLRPVPAAVPQGLGQRIVVNLDVPQAVVTFGGPGIARSDPDFMAAYIVNHILGGGSFSSRLYREVREKRGLAYSVYDALVWLQHAAIFIGDTATRSDRAGDTLKVIEREIKRLADEGPTADELAAAKDYLKGSFALNLDTSGKIASQLVQMQIDNLGIDYIDRRSALIDAVSIADTRRVAKRLLSGGILTTVVGRTPDVSETEPAMPGAETGGG